MQLLLLSFCETLAAACAAAAAAAATAAARFNADDDADVGKRFSVDDDDDVGMPGTPLRFDSDEVLALRDDRGALEPPKLHNTNDILQTSRLVNRLLPLL